MHLVVARGRHIGLEACPESIKYQNLSWFQLPFQASSSFSLFFSFSRSFFFFLSFFRFFFAYLLLFLIGFFCDFFLFFFFLSLSSYPSSASSILFSAVFIVAPMPLCDTGQGTLSEALSIQLWSTKLTALIPFNIKILHMTSSFLDLSFSFCFHYAQGVSYGIFCLNLNYLKRNYFCLYFVGLKILA